MSIIKTSIIAVVASAHSAHGLSSPLRGDVDFVFDHGQGVSDNAVLQSSFGQLTKEDIASLIADTPAEPTGAYGGTGAYGAPYPAAGAYDAPCPAAAAAAAAAPTPAPSVAPSRAPAQIKVANQRHQGEVIPGMKVKVLDKLPAKYAAACRTMEGEKGKVTRIFLRKEAVSKKTYVEVELEYGILLGAPWRVSKHAIPQEEFWNFFEPLL